MLYSFELGNCEALFENQGDHTINLGGIWSPGRAV